MLISNVGRFLEDQNNQRKNILDNKQYPSKAVEAPVVINYEKALNAMAPPLPLDEDKMIRQLRDNTLNNKKKKYEPGETKEEIYQNIINNKPSVNNLRLELTAYADIVMEEDLF